jgi:four helix bundle protein
MSRSYKNLNVWEKAHAFVRRVYEITNRFPEDEKYGITSQLRRATVAVPTNIAEGSGRRTQGAYVQHLDIALGSANEVDYLLLLSLELEYIDSSVYDELSDYIEVICKMLNKLISSLLKKNA